MDGPERSEREADVMVIALLIEVEENHAKQVSKSYSEWGSPLSALDHIPLGLLVQHFWSLVLKAGEGGTDEIYLHDFPGGPKAFEICSKFCYGMTVTLNAYNVVTSRCAAEYLEMTEDVEKGNLIYKIEVFLNSSVLRSWKDSIIVLQTTKSLLPWSEELKVVGRCIDCITTKTSVEPASVTWSYTYNRKLTASDDITETQKRMHQVPNDWWIEDICELDVDLYKRVIVALKLKGRMSSDMIGEALKAYAVRWLPDSYDALVADDYMKRNRILVETVIYLLPSDKYSGCSCRFLLKLLKVVILVGARDPLKEELIDRISMQLHKASVKDLLIPAKSSGDTIYDNERLPLRVVVQVLFFEQLKAAGGASVATNDASHDSLMNRAASEEDWEGRVSEQLGSSKIKADECRHGDGKKSVKDKSSSLLLPSRSRRIFDKLWVGKGQ
ncbi:hypothetical protein BHE74_00009993, partial [Ensete ventricosum]